MFVRRNIRTYKGKTYTNYLLVESVRTPNGPRQRTICSLGDLGPASREVWLDLARKLERSLIEPDERDEVARESGGERMDMRRASSEPQHQTAAPGKTVEGEALMSIDSHAIATEDHCEVGAVHVGHEFWKRLGLDSILREIGLSEAVQRLACAMTLNCLVAPVPERAMPNWIRRTGLADLLGIDVDGITETKLCEALDAIHPHRAAIEAALLERERDLFNHDASIYLCDLASVSILRPAYRGRANGKAMHDDERDHPDECVEVAVALALGPEGFPICHEISAGGIADGAALEEMLARMAERGGLAKGTIVAIDRRLSDEGNLDLLKQRGLNFVITNHRSDNDRALAHFAEAMGFTQIIRIPPTADTGLQSPLVDVLLRDKNGQAYILYYEEGRVAKDRAARRRQERFLLADFDKLRVQIREEPLASPERIREAIGGLKERYSRVATYYRIAYEAAPNAIFLVRDYAKASYSEQLDGACLLQTDRVDILAGDVRRLCSLLTRVRDAFCEKGRPQGGFRLFSHLEARSEVQIFLHVLAFHLIGAIEKRLRENTAHKSWVAVREILRSHQLCTVAAPTDDGGCLRVRGAAKPDPDIERLYEALGVSARVIEPIRSWSDRGCGEGSPIQEWASGAPHKARRTSRKGRRIGAHF